ncbi:hypothetical protein PILCRDRAFT_816792, partial [Piloderma croceum F 1598]
NCPWHTFSFLILSSSRLFSVRQSFARKFSDCACMLNLGTVRGFGQLRPQRAHSGLPVYDHIPPARFREMDGEVFQDVEHIGRMQSLG